MFMRLFCFIISESTFCGSMIFTSASTVVKRCLSRDALPATNDVHFIRVLRATEFPEGQVSPTRDGYTPVVNSL